MVRALRWAALVAILAFPVIAYLGRRVPSNECVGRVGACDILWTRPSWAIPAEIIALSLAALLLVIAAVLSRPSHEDV